MPKVQYKNYTSLLVKRCKDIETFEKWTDQTIQLWKRGPKTIGSTRKELLSQVKKCNIEGYTRGNKQLLRSTLSKVKLLAFKEHDLQQLNKTQLKILL